MNFSDDKILTPKRISELMELALKNNVGVTLSYFQTLELRNHIKYLEDKTRNFDDFVIELIETASKHDIDLE